MSKSRSKIRLHELAYIVSRNVFLFTNGIIFAVVVFLLVFGATRAGVFLGIVSVLNIFLGLAQDIHAWIALEKLQLMTAPRVLRINSDGSEELVLAEEVRKGDQIKLEIGNQVPCDSSIQSVHDLEVNEGLITGESNSIPKFKGDHLLAGSIVVSGSGTIRVTTVFRESRIARMTTGIQRYSPKTSQIQDAVALVVKYSVFVLLGVLTFVVGRGFMVREGLVHLVLNIGALTSMLVPQGLVFAVTLFFAYGAAHFFRRNVLLQEVNATEKLGRIRNLCMDKTGTLTENVLMVETMAVAPGVLREKAEKCASTYAQGVDAASEIIRAVKKFLNREYTGDITETLPFSSWRRYGAVCANDTVILAGSPDVFFDHLSQKENNWLQSVITEHAYHGKRFLCFARSSGATVPRELSKIKLSLLAVFVFHNNLREGVRDTIQFFQSRGVCIRIISGDHPETVRAIAALSGIKDTEKLITGPEMGLWNRSDFEENVKRYTIFAQIVPEQKEKIIEAFKKDGFTAMVGDGANDALAVKKADLGIAMFDGASATRQVASVVLTGNSFAALPGGVELADSIIRNIEIFASIFLNLTFLGFLIFVAISLLGHAYPLTPLNVTLINYFTIGIPGLLISYWAISPRGKVPPASTEPFLKRIIPFALSSALLQALGVMIAFVLSPEALQAAESNFSVILAFIVLGFIFFVCAPGVYRGITTRLEKMQLFCLGVFEVLLLLFVLRTPFLLSFFNVAYIQFSLQEGLWAVFLLCLFGVAQYLVSKLFNLRKFNERAVPKIPGTSSRSSG